MKILIEQVVRRAHEGETFFLGVTRYYLDGQQFHASGLTLCYDTFGDVEITEDTFAATFYFPAPNRIRVDFKDIHLIRNINGDFYSNIDVLKNFINEF